MLAPLSWLKDYVDIDVTPKELEEKLFSCGFEVEELIEVGKDVSGVVVGLVETCEPIPDTHLSLCQVNAGEHGTFQRRHLCPAVRHASYSGVKCAVFACFFTLVMLLYICIFAWFSHSI